jgi:hypothetical protein
VICNVFLRGISTRDVAGALKPLLGTTISASAVSRITKRLNHNVKEFHQRSLFPRGSAAHGLLPPPLPAGYGWTAERFSLFPVLALVAGVFAYASSVMCYTFGFFPLNFILRNRVKCSWGFFPRQASHGLFMLVFGLLIVLVAIRPLIISRGRKHIEKVLEYVLLGLGVLQFLIGLFAIMDR